MATKNTPELVQKLYEVTELHFMDYRSALHDSGNYRLSAAEQHYVTKDPFWRCKTEDEKTALFEAFLKDTKQKKSTKFITSKDGKYTVINKAKGTAKKPCQRKRPVNERALKR